MIYRYMPIVRWKAGERDALKWLSTLGKGGVAPIIQLAVQQFVGKKATKKRPPLAAPAVLVLDLQASWGTAPFYFDASDIASVPTGHPLIGIAAAARAAGLNLIPATRLTAPAAYQQAIAAVNALDGRGIALRIDLHDMTSAATWAPSWPYPLSQTDLVIDLGSNVGLVSKLGATLDAAFKALFGGTSWRTVTIAGTSIPDNFSGVTAGIHFIDRAELALWNHLNSIQLSYRLDFGDYATVPLGMPPEGIKWGYPINVKYTLPKQFMICRGVRTKGIGAQDMSLQLVGHATSIVGTPNRQALAHCWADGRINSIAQTLAGQGGLPGWVTFSVNRHIEITRALLP